MWFFSSMNFKKMLNPLKIFIMRIKKTLVLCCSSNPHHPPDNIRKAELQNDMLETLGRQHYLEAVV